MATPRGRQDGFTAEREASYALEIASPFPRMCRTGQPGGMLDLRAFQPRNVQNPDYTRDRG